MQQEDIAITIYKKFASDTLKNEKIIGQIKDAEKLFKLIYEQSCQSEKILLENLQAKMFSLIAKLELDLISYLLKEYDLDKKA